jgi:hypothetical protein
VDWSSVITDVIIECGSDSLRFKNREDDHALIALAIYSDAASAIEKTLRHSGPKADADRKAIVDFLSDKIGRESALTCVRIRLTYVCIKTS